MITKSLKNNLTKLLNIIVDEAGNNPEFAAKLEAVFNPEGTAPVKESKQSRTKRNPAVLDPLEIASGQGMDALERKLLNLDIDQLKDIIAQYGMNQDKLAMKWRKKEKCLERIMEKTRDRTIKGDAFRK